MEGTELRDLPRKKEDAIVADGIELLGVREWK